jgi:hypothetical protein
MPPHLLATTLASLLTIATVWPDDDVQQQRVLLALNGPDGARGFGSVLAPAGDLDDDGVPDLLVGAPQLSSGATQQAGLLMVISGADGSTLVTLTGQLPGEAFGSAAALISDLDHDGWPEVLVGAPRHDGFAINAGVARVHSGRSGKLLYYKRSKGLEPEPMLLQGEEPFGYLGSSVAATNDLDGDGVDDFLVGGPSDPGSGSEPGQVVVVSGAGARVLIRHWGNDRFELFGHAIASIPDLDGDGASDIVVGAPGARDDDGVATGRVVLLSARSGRVLREIRGSPGERFGSALAVLPDVDADGVSELLIGAPGAAKNGPGSGSAYLVSGASGEILRSFHGSAAHDQFGFSVAWPGDVDGDGAPDLLLGSHGADPGGYGSGSARVISSVDGRVILELAGLGPGQGLGYAVSAVGDLDGDGLDDVAIGQLGQSGPTLLVGAVQVVAGLPRPVLPPEEP